MKEFKIKDLNVIEGQLILEPISEKEEIGGLIKPQEHEAKSEIGKIVAMNKKTELRLEIGMIILFNKYAPTVFHLQGKEYLVLREEDVIAYI